MNETVKILGQKDLKITATAVRVPVFCGHAEVMNIELSHRFDLKELRAYLESSKGIVLMDDTKGDVFPTPKDVAGRDEVFVGRIRRDDSVKNGLSLFCVADNLRKGAATNAVQIVESLVEELIK
jgi:aspartate-semialdehyde dehydrogenase